MSAQTPEKRGPIRPNLSPCPDCDGWGVGADRPEAFIPCETCNASGTSR